LENGELVVFAGAGVSMGPPAGLPSYWSLANAIAGQLGAKPLGEKETTPPDLFLSRLKRDGHNVHKVAGSLIQRACTPNEYHKLILCLFRDPAKIRIVTSNFDPLFSKAAVELGLPLHTYVSPALPLAEDFVGAVHLHGSSADYQAERMVLTSDDFGQAYLTRGWARTFLLDLYARYTVLFVGYSHADVPLQYLAYGLRSTGTKPRYVLDSQPPEIWADFGISLIPYILEPEGVPDRYVNLKIGLRKWVAEVVRKPLEIEERLDHILRSSAAPSAAEEDFLLRSLKLASSAGHFVCYAKGTGLRWLEWLDGKGELRRYLHLSVAGADQAGQTVARWIGREIVHSTEGRGLLLIERHEERVGDIVWDAMAWELVYSDGGLLRTEEGPKWVAFLLSSPQTTRNTYHLNLLLKSGANQKLWAICSRVFDVLTIPTVKLFELPPIGPARRGADLAIALHGDLQNLVLTWEEAIVPALREIAPLVAPMLEAKLNHAHDLAVLAGNADSFRNPVLYTRQNIEFDAHPTFARGVDLLINFFARVLESLESARDRGMDDWADRLLRSSNPILIRFGLFVLRRCKSLAPTAKLSWLIDRSLFFPPAYGGTREVYEVLIEIYASLDSKDRERLWTGLEGALPLPEDTSDEAPLRREQIDRICWHIAKGNLSDPAAQAAWTRLEIRNAQLAGSEPWLPGEFMRDVAGAVGDRSPLSVTKLLAESAAAHLDLILEYRGENWPNPNRDGLLGALAAAARENKTWGAELMRGLTEREAWKTDVWRTLFWSFRYSDLSPSDQEWFLRSAAPHLSAHADNVDSLGQFLYHGQTVEELRAIDRVELNRRIDFSAVLWASARASVKLKETDPKKIEWLNTAINRAPGWIAEFWLVNQQLVAEATTEGEPTWPNAVALCVGQVAAGETDADLLALAVFTCSITFLRRSAPAWVRDQLYRCLDFGAFGAKAWAPWSSLLQYASLSRDVAIELKEPLRAAFGQLAAAPDDIAKMFLVNVAAISAHMVFDIEADGWLEAFLHTITPAQRAEWTRDLARTVNQLLPDERRKLWQKWAKAYWTKRSDRGIPTIEPAESEAFLRLATAFQEDFPQAVSLLVNLPAPSIAHFIPTELAKGEFPAANPEAFMQAVNWLLDGTHSLILPDEVKKVYERMPRHRSLLPLWDAFCQKLSKLNVPEARDLQAIGQTWFNE
jgi:hypothetical protein